MNSLHLDTNTSAKFLSRRGFLAGTGGAFALLALAGCRSAVGGDGGGGASTEGSDGATGGGSAAVQNLVLATAAAPDPAGILHRQVDTPGYINLVFDRLVDLDPDTMTPVPWLATDWQWNDDRSVLVLSLREDVTWHSGREFGAEDVVFSLNAAQEPEARSQVAGILGRIESIEATGAHEVTLTFAEPTSNIFDALAFNPIVDPETYAEAAQGKTIVGTGPFTWESFIPGQELVVKANENYWGGRPSLDQVTVRAVENAQALLAGLQSDQFGLIGGVPGRDLAVLDGQDRFSLMSVESSYQQTYVAADITTAPFDDPRVRQALQYAVDRQRIVEQVYGGFGNISCVPWPAGTPGVTEDQVSRYSFDVDKAKALIDEAGATGAAVTIYTASSPIFNSVMEVVQYNLTEIGLDVKVEGMEDTEFGERLRGGELPGLFIANVGLVSVSPLTGISSAAPLRPSGNPSHLDSAEYQELQERAYGATSDEEAADINFELGEFFLEQSFHITLAQAFETYAMDSSLTGVDTNLLGYIKADNAAFNA